MNLWHRLSTLGTHGPQTRTPAIRTDFNAWAPYSLGPGLTRPAWFAASDTAWRVLATAGDVGYGNATVTIVALQLLCHVETRYKGRTPDQGWYGSGLYGVDMHRPGS